MVKTNRAAKTTRAIAEFWQRMTQALPWLALSGGRRLPPFWGTVERFESWHRQAGAIDVDMYVLKLALLSRRGGCHLSNTTTSRCVSSYLFTRWSREAIESRCTRRSLRQCQTRSRRRRQRSYNHRRCTFRTFADSMPVDLRTRHRVYRQTCYHTLVANTTTSSGQRRSFIMSTVHQAVQVANETFYSLYQNRPTNSRRGSLELVNPWKLTIAGAIVSAEPECSTFGLTFRLFGFGGRGRGTGVEVTLLASVNTVPTQCHCQEIRTNHNVTSHQRAFFLIFLP